MVVEKEARPRPGTQITRTAYRDLFGKSVQLYRAGAALLATPLTPDEQTFLREFFPARLVQGVKVVVVPALQLPFVVNVKAMTIGSDLIVVKDGQRTQEILKHELVHVCQVDREGLDRFIRDYADQYVDGGYAYDKITFEREAWGFHDLTGPIATYLGYCQ